MTQDEKRDKGGLKASMEEVVVRGVICADATGEGAGAKAPMDLYTEVMVVSVEACRAERRFGEVLRL